MWQSVHACGEDVCFSVEASNELARWYAANLEFVTEVSACPYVVEK